MHTTLTFSAAPTAPLKITAEQLAQMDAATLLRCEAPFTIHLNGQVYFSDEYFCILEFLLTLLRWQEAPQGSAFAYVAADTQDNPLIAFLPTDSGWTIDSPWGQFDAASLPVEEAELLRAVDGLIHTYID